MSEPCNREVTEEVPLHSGEYPHVLMQVELHQFCGPSPREALRTMKAEVRSDMKWMRVCDHQLAVTCFCPNWCEVQGWSAVAFHSSLGSVREFDKAKIDLRVLGLFAQVLQRVGALGHAL